MTRSKQALSVKKKNAQTVVDQLVKGLRTAPALDPSSPCVVALPTLFQQMKEDASEMARKRAMSTPSFTRLTYPELLDAAAAFVNSKWTKEERLAYESCSCDSKEHRVGRSGRPLITSGADYSKNMTPLCQITMSIFAMLTAVAVEMSSNRTASRRLEKESEPGKRGRWPSSPSQFIPNGSSAALASFINWSYITSSAMPIQLLCHLTFCCPSLTSVITESDVFLPTIEHLVRELISAIHDLIANGVPDEHALYFAQNILCFRSIFFCDWFRNQAIKPEYVERHAGQLLSLYNAISDCFPLLDKFEFSHFDLQGVKTGFCSAGMLIYSSLDAASISPLPSSEVSLAFAEMIQPFMGEFNIILFSALVRNIRFLRTKRKCTHITCLETGEDTKTNFKWCSACQAVRYCSKTCQVSDWAEHKQVCGLLKRVPLPLHQANPDSIGSKKASHMSTVKENMRDTLRRAQEAGLTEKDIERLTEYVNPRSRPQAQT